MADLQPKKATLAWEFPFEGAWTSSVAFLGDDILAAGNQLGQIYLWRLPSKVEKGKPAPVPFRRLDGHSNAVTNLTVASDNTTLISSSLDRTVRFWDTTGSPSGKASVLMDCDAHEEAKRRRRKTDGLMSPVEVELQAASESLTSHQDWIQAMGRSADGKRLITGDDKSQAIVWDLATHKEVTRWSGLPWNWIIAAGLSPDGKSAIVSEYHPRRDDFDAPAPALRVFDVETGKPKFDLLKMQIPKYDPNSTSYGSMRVWVKFVARGLLGASYSPDGKWIAAGQSGETGTGQVHLFDAATGKFKRSVASHRYGVTDVTFSSDSKYVLSSGRDTSLRIVQLSDGKEVAQLGKPRGGQFKDWLYAIAFSASQRWLAAADIAGKVLVWQM